jgi:cytochrome o ubiquinol oxidase subunit III
MNVMAHPPGLTLIAEHDHDHDQAASALSGFWLFMMSDLIIFGLMFATYVTMLTPMSFAGGPTPKELFELPGAAMETAALLTSTFTFGMASLAIKYERGNSQVVSWLLVTLEQFSVDVNRNSKGVPKSAQIRFGLL